MGFDSFKHGFVAFLWKKLLKFRRKFVKQRVVYCREAVKDTRLITLFPKTKGHDRHHC